MLRPKSNYLLVTAAAAMLLTGAALADTKVDDRSYLPPQQLQALKQELQAPKKEAARPQGKLHLRTARYRIPRAKLEPRIAHYGVPYRQIRHHYAYRQPRRAVPRYYASPGFFPGFFFGRFP
jgi:hypothetical protein